MLGQTLLKHTYLLGQIGLLGKALLEQTVSSQVLVGSERGLWKRALTQLEDLHAVVDVTEAGTEETGLDAV